MNFREDLELKLQKVNLAIAEINECKFDTDKQRKLKLEILSKIKNEIIERNSKLNLDLLKI
tara:strand:+ start:1117 stop:1299 length:183 start_codon:yes stop_codon:yes gene_type:complete